MIGISSKRQRTHSFCVDPIVSGDSDNIFGDSLSSQAATDSFMSRLTKDYGVVGKYPRYFSDRNLGASLAVIRRLYMRFVADAAHPLKESQFVAALEGILSRNTQNITEKALVTAIQSKNTYDSTRKRRRL